MKRIQVYGLKISLFTCLLVIVGIYIKCAPEPSGMVKTEWNGARRYTIETYQDPVYGTQKRVVGVEQPQVEGMVDPVMLAGEIDAISRFQVVMQVK